MKIKIIKAKTLFTITDFPKPTERIEPWEQSARDPHTYEIIAFNLPCCKQGIEFKQSDFEKHVEAPNTCLSEKDEAEIEKASKRLVKKNPYFLDFYCPKCGAAVRIYYDAGVAGRGEMFYSLAYVVFGIN